MTFAEILIQVEAKGGTLEAVQRETRLQAHHTKSIPFKNMIRALQMHAWLNSKDDWIRLAGAMLARKRNRSNSVNNV